MKTIYLVQNDTAPALEVALIDANTGDPIDLSVSGTTVDMHFKKAGTDAQVLPLLITEPVNGVCVLMWPDGSLAETGSYLAEIQITWGGTGKIQTTPDRYQFNVRGELA